MSVVLDENLHVVVFAVAELNFEDTLNYPWLGVYGPNWLMYVVKTFDLRCENAAIQRCDKEIFSTPVDVVRTL